MKPTLLMRRTLLSAVCFTAVPALATNNSVTGVADINGESDLYRLEAGARFQNITATGELALNGKERRREFFVAKVVYHQPLANDFFLEPELSYGIPLGNNDWRNLNGQAVRASDLWKAGVKLGWDTAQSGPFSSIRLRYDHGGLEIRTEEEGKALRKLLRTDFAVGYHFAQVNASGNWVHERSRSAFRFGNGQKDHDTLELKLSYTGLSSLTPYVQYNFKEQVYDESGDRKHNDSVKLGLVLVF